MPLISDFRIWILDVWFDIWDHGLEAVAIQKITHSYYAQLMLRLRSARAIDNSQ
jgi:hypothetical protein